MKETSPGAGPEFDAALMSFDGTPPTGEAAAAAVEQAAQPAEYQVDVMSSIARAVEAHESSSPHISKRASQEVMDRAKDVVEYLITVGGRVVREEVPLGNVSSHVMDQFNFDNREWTNVKNFLKKHDLVTLEKPYPGSRQFSAIAINEETLPQEAAAAALVRTPERTATPAAGTDSRPETADDSDAYEPDDEYDDETMAMVRQLDLKQTAAKGRQNGSRKKAKSDKAWKDKRIQVIIRTDEFYYGETLTAKAFSELDDETKLAMSVGMLENPAYDCIDTPEARESFMLRMLNKGVSDEASAKTPEDLRALIDDAIAAGNFSANGDGPVLTEKGMKLVKKVRPGRKQSTFPL